MNKANLQIGKKYLHIRKTVIDGVEREAERWIKCIDITKDGAYFARMMEVMEFLNNSRLLQKSKRIRSAAYPSGGARGISGNCSVSLPESDNRPGI